MTGPAKTPAKAAPRAHRARKTAASAVPAPVEPDELVPKHIRFGKRTYAAAEERARAEGRDYIDVLRAFNAKYAAGLIDTP